MTLLHRQTAKTLTRLRATQSGQGLRCSKEIFNHLQNDIATGQDQSSAGDQLVCVFRVT